MARSKIALSLALTLSALTLGLSGCAVPERISIERAESSERKVVETGKGYGGRTWSYIDANGAEFPLTEKCEGSFRTLCYGSEDGSVEFHYRSTRRGTTSASITVDGEKVEADCAVRGFWDSTKVCAPFERSDPSEER